MSDNDNLKFISKLIDAMNPSEVEWMYRYAEKKQAMRIQNLAFSSLKNSKLVFGGVSKIINFLPIGLYLEGWLLPCNNYDVIEIYSGNKYLGQATTGIVRKDVYSGFRFFNENNAGFNCFIESKTEDWVNAPITIIVKLKGKLVKKFLVNIDGKSIQTSLEELGKNVFLDKDNILVPTLSNRLKMIHKLKSAMPEYNFVNLIEGMEKSIEEVEKNLQKKEGLLPQELNELQLFMIPTLLRRNLVPLASADMSRLDEGQEVMFKKVKFLQESSENFQKKYGVSQMYAEKFSLAAYEYAQSVIGIVKPKCVLMWNKYSPWHMILDGVCKSQKIPVVYMESGLLPGTYIFETMGQMGGSYPALKSEEFKILSVDGEDVEEAKQIKEQLFESKLNRWSVSDPSVYQKSEKERVLELLDETRPTILYAGQNDFESGLFPYTEETKKIHSPIFESSDEAAVFLGKLAEKNKWNMIYKRHPMMQGRTEVVLPEHVIISDKIDIHDAIDISDLTITILSQTSYVALIRNKPALMLGYHQLCGKGCLYEAHERKLVEPTIKIALKEGFSEKMQEAFLIHMAQLCKYYLYTDFIDGRISFGKSEEDLILYLRNIIQTRSANAEYEIAEKTCRREEERELETAKENVVVSKFYLELSLKERVERRYLKYILNPARLFMRSKNLSDLLCESAKIQGSLEKNLMYISQLEQSELNQNNWSAHFCDTFFEIILGGIDSIYNFVSKCKELHREVATRLAIERNLYQSIGKAILNEKVSPLYLKACLIEENVPLRKYFVETLCKNIRTFDEHDKEIILNHIETVINSEKTSFIEKCGLFELLFKMELFSAHHLKLWNHFFLEADDTEFLYYYGGFETGWMPFVKPEYLYDDYYKDRKKVLRYLSEKLTEERHYTIEKKTQKSNRISVLVTGLHGKLYASTRLEMGICNELSNRGYEVMIHVADTNYIADSNRFSIPPATLRKNFSTIFKKEHWGIAEPNVQVKYFDVEEGAIDRYWKYIDSIHEFNPSVVLDFTQDQPIYNIELRKRYPVIHIPLNGYCSSAEYDAYIARSIPLVTQCNQIFESVNSDNLYEANVYLPQEINEDIVYKRQKYGIEENDFVLVTVGNRLIYELTEEIQKDMYELLKNLNNVRWILVGNIHSDLPILKELINSRKVIKWGYEKNLDALYRMCDIYMNLPRSGGGGSVAYAVQVGIPALISNTPSDILPFLGEENSAASWKEEQKMLLKAMDSEGFRKKLLFKQQKNLKDDKWKIENFVNILEKAIAEIR